MNILDDFYKVAYNFYISKNEKDIPHVSSVSLISVLHVMNVLSLLFLWIGSLNLK